MKRGVLVELIENGLSTYGIARELSIGQTTVRYWLNKYGLKTKHHGSERKTRLCLTCGDEFYDIKKNGSPRFCSRSCYAKYRAELAKERWEEKVAYMEESGRIKDSGNNLVYARKYLLYKHGNVCSICGIHEWAGKPAPLVVDHINGNPYDNRIVNFRLVCANCDAQLPTYKSKNMGNGRSERRVK